MAFWCKFPTHKPGCVEGTRDEIETLAERLTGEKPTEIFGLPYPANPRLNKVEHPKYGACPSFCYTPEQCKGRSSCPKSYACSE